AVVVPRLSGRQPAAWEVERQAAELLAQAHDHVAEHEGPLSGAHQKQRRAGPLVDIVDPLAADIGEPDQEGEGGPGQPLRQVRLTRVPWNGFRHRWPPVSLTGTEA